MGPSSSGRKRRGLGGPRRLRDKYGPGDCVEQSRGLGPERPRDRFSTLSGEGVSRSMRLPGAVGGRLDLRASDTGRPSYPRKREHVRNT